MANEFVARNGLIAKNNSQIEGTTTIFGPWNSNFINGLHFSFNSNTGSIYSLQNGTAWRRLDIEGNPLVLNWQSAGNVGIGTTTPTSKLHIVDSTYFKVAHFEGTNGAPLEIWTSDEVLQGGYDATQGSIGIGSNRLQIKYGTISSEWADAAYHLYVGDIDLTTAYYIHYPGVYEVTVGSVTGGEAIYLDAPYNWSSGVKITLINATDEVVYVNIDGSGDRYLEGTAINIGVLSPRSIVEYVSTGTTWRMMPSMKQITYTGISLGGADYYIYTKGVYQIGVGSGYNLHFPNAGNFEGETITILNVSENTVDLANNGFRPYDVDDSTITELLSFSAYQFICIGSNWRMISRYNV
jgi:hypothetical protein